MAYSLEAQKHFHSAEVARKKTEEHVKKAAMSGALAAIAGMGTSVFLPIFGAVVVSAEEAVRHSIIAYRANQTYKTEWGLFKQTSPRKEW